MSQTMTLLDSNLNLFLMLLSFAAGLLGIFFVVKTLHKQSIRSLTTSRLKIDWKRFWFAFLFWGIISSGLVLIDHYMSPENYVFNFKLVPFLILAAIAIVFVPLQTSFEEYLFRGYLMQGIGVLCKNKWVPLVITSRRDDLLLDEKTIQRMWVMRKYLADMNPVEAMEFINDRFKQTRNNEEFLISMNG